MQEKYDPFCVLLSAFSVSSLAGLAAILRSGRRLSPRTIVSAVLNSGMLGLAIACTWYHYWPAHLWFILGVSILAGLGGLSLIDFVVQAIRHGGVNIQIRLMPGEEGSGEKNPLSGE